MGIYQFPYGNVGQFKALKRGLKDEMIHKWALGISNGQGSSGVWELSDGLDYVDSVAVRNNDREAK